MGLRQSVSCLDNQVDQGQHWFLGGVFSLSFLWYLTTRHPQGLPPAPTRGLPVVGHSYMLEKDPRCQFKRWREKLGDVFSLYLGPRLVVVLNGLPAISEAVVDNGRVFNDRPHPARRVKKDIHSTGYGLLSASGKEWQEQRAVTHTILRQMGSLHNNVVGEKIQQEIDHFIKIIHDLKDGPALDLRPLIQSSVTNSLWSIMFGTPEEYDNAFFKYFTDSIHNHFQRVGESNIIHFLPSLCTNPTDVSLLRRPEEVIDSLKTLRTYVTQKVAQLLKLNPSRTHSFVGGYVEKSEELELSTSAFLNKLDPETSIGSVGGMSSMFRNDSENQLNELNLRRVIFDLFIAGAETTSIILQWLLLLFIRYPELQERCYRDIVKVTQGRTATMDDRSEMVYVEATIMEVLRFCDIMPLGIPHGAANKTMFRKFHLPKNVTVALNLNSVLKDHGVWGDPDRFRPERFITLEGKLEKPPEYIPFGIGKRTCIGASLAQAHLFLYVCNLVQRFRFVPEARYRIPPVQGNQGIFYNPPNFRLRVLARDTAIQ